MRAPATRTSSRLPERGEPRLARCEVCGHRHACYVTDWPGSGDVERPSWSSQYACLGCLMQAADPMDRVAGAGRSRISTG